MGHYGELQYHQQRALGEETYHEGIFLSLPTRFPSVPARQKSNSLGAPVGLRFFSGNSADHPLFKSPQDRVAQFLRNLSPDFLYLLVGLHSKTQRKHFSFLFFSFFRKSVNRMKDLGEKLKMWSGQLSLQFHIYSPGFHINERKPGHEQHRLKDHIEICFYMHKTNQYSTVLSLLHILSYLYRYSH